MQVRAAPCGCPLVSCNRSSFLNSHAWEVPLKKSREAAKYLSPGREPWDLNALTPPSAPLSRLAGEGQGERDGAFNPRLAPWAMLWRSFGAELCCELRLQDTGVAV
jgi:hypothetical protein